MSCGRLWCYTKPLNLIFKCSVMQSMADCRNTSKDHVLSASGCFPVRWDGERFVKRDELLAAAMLMGVTFIFPQPTPPRCNLLSLTGCGPYRCKVHHPHCRKCRTDQDNHCVLFLTL